MSCFKQRHELCISVTQLCDFPPWLGVTHVGAGAKKGPGRLNRAKYGPPRWEDLQLRAQSSGRISQFVVHDDDDIPVARMEADIIIGWYGRECRAPRIGAFISLLLARAKKVRLGRRFLELNGCRFKTACLERGRHALGRCTHEWGTAVQELK